MIDINKKYRTRDGREVRIYATDGDKGEEIHGAFKNVNGKWWASIWEDNGKNAYKRREADLIEVPSRHKRTVWLSVHSDRVVAWNTRNHVDCFSSKDDRIACI